MDCSSDFHFTVFMIYVFSMSEPVGERKLKRDQYTWSTEKSVYKRMCYSNGSLGNFWLEGAC